MVHHISILTAEASDAEKIARISIVTFTETFADTNSKEDMDLYLSKEMNVEKIRCELQDPDSTFFLAWDGTELAGFAKVNSDVKADAPECDNPLEIERLYVLQEYQGKKVGAALMNHCLAFAHRNHHSTVWLGVWENNTKAIAFYKKWGYEPFGTHIFRLGTDDQTDILMKKELTGKPV